MSESAQRELAELLRDARPSERYSPPHARSGTYQAAPRGGRQQSSGRLFEALPGWVHVELPALGGHACIVSHVRERMPLGTISTLEHDTIRCVECTRCGQPRRQQLTDRSFEGGETWAVLRCECNQGKQA